MGAAVIPEYSCRKDNHIFLYQQKMTLLVLRQEESVSYERFCEKLDSYPVMIELLGLERVPHPATLSKFSSIIEHEYLDLVITCFYLAVRNEGPIASLDSTGLSVSSASKHILRRIKQIGSSTDEKTSVVRGFVKHPLFVRSRPT